MSSKFNENNSKGGASSDIIAIAGLNLALSYENAR